MEGSAGFTAGHDRPAAGNASEELLGVSFAVIPLGHKAHQNSLGPDLTVGVSGPPNPLTCSSVKFWGRLSVLIPQQLYPSFGALKPKRGFRKTKRTWGSIFLWLHQSTRVNDYKRRLKMTLRGVSDQLLQAKGTMATEAFNLDPLGQFPRAHCLEHHLNATLPGKESGGLRRL